MKKKILLINLPPAESHNYNKESAVFPATGILVVGTLFKKHGFSVKVIDGTVERHYKEMSLNSIDEHTTFVGFSVMTSQVDMALNLSGLIKSKYPSVSVIWGGIHPILFPKQTVENPNIDIVVTGEGYETIAGLIDFINGAIDSREQISGIGFVDAEEKVVLTAPGNPDNIESIPHFDFSILDNLEVYLNTRSAYQSEISSDNNEELRVMPVLTGLGCCYKCQFCINVILKRRYRFRSAASIIEEVKRLQREYKANTFVFYDEDFFISKKRLYQFLDLKEKENLEFYWRIWGRVDYFKDDYINRELVLRLERNGLRSIAMGAESGSQNVLDLIQKGIKVENILHAVKMLDGTQITPRCSFIVGLEGEGREDTMATYKLCAQLIRANTRVNIAGPFIFRLYPGSPIFERTIDKYGIRMPDKVGDWHDSLHEEGYLKFVNMPWLWPGFMEDVTVLNNNVAMHNKLRNKNNIIVHVIKRFIIWRLTNFNTFFPVENYSLHLVRKFYYIFLNIRKVVQTTLSGSQVSQ